MIRSRLGLRAIGLCLALAGLMAVSAGVGPGRSGILLVSQRRKSHHVITRTDGRLENKHGTLLGEIGGVGIHILCTGVDIRSRQSSPGRRRAVRKSKVHGLHSSSVKNIR